MMNAKLTRRFPPFADEQSLRSAIAQVCSEFGKLSRLDILPATRGSGLQCACFLQMETAGATAKLKSKLLMIHFGNELGFFVSVGEEWRGPRM